MTGFKVQIAGLGLMMCLCGCTGTLLEGVGSARQPATAGAAHYDFSWVLSGSRHAAPLQVFDDGRRTWLQFSKAQPDPDIQVRTAQGSQPVPYVWQGVYAVLNGVWPHLLVRVGDAQAVIEKTSLNVALNTPAGKPETRDLAKEAAALSAPEKVTLNAAGEAGGMASQKEGVAAALSDPAAAAQRVGSGDKPLEPVRSFKPAATDVIAAAAEPVTPKVSGFYQLSQGDGTLRQALARWARQAGWTFEREHWDVDVDIPIVGTAQFEMSFEDAVQAMLAATELADRPLQPCFYANQVVRVVPYAQVCDRTAVSERGQP